MRIAWPSNAAVSIGRPLSHVDDRPTSCFQGAYEEIVRDSRLVYTWTHVDYRAEGGPSSTPASLVTVLFDAERDGAQTRISLRHERILAEPARRNVGAGWAASFASLKGVLAKPPAAAG